MGGTRTCNGGCIGSHTLAESRIVNSTFSSSRVERIQRTSGFAGKLRRSPTSFDRRCSKCETRFSSGLRDVLRTGGSTGYQQAVSGLNDGVDGRGSTMNSFLGVKVLTDLLLMGKCGVFVDNPILPEHRLSDAQGLHPYLYSYQLEDIINFATTKPESPSEFKAVLLRDTTLDFDGVQGLPSRTVQRYRSLWINDQGTVSLQMYDDKGEADGEERVLELTKFRSCCWTLATVLSRTCVTIRLRAQSW